MANEQLLNELEHLNEEQLKQVRSFIHFLKSRLVPSPELASSLQAQLREGAIHRAARDLNLTEDWFDLEEEVWLHH